MNVYLIRHGMTEPAKKRLYYADTDVPLNEEGKRQLLEFTREGAYPSPEGRALYTSGMLRAEQTFRLIYGSRPHLIAPDLTEQHLGEYEMRSHEELKKLPPYQAFLACTNGSARFPGGESSNEWSERVWRAFEPLLAERRDVILVAHGGVIGYIMNRCFPKVERHFYLWIPQPGRGYCATRQNGVFTCYERI